jgi:hypothetical protein
MLHEQDVSWLEEADQVHVFEEVRRHRWVILSIVLILCADTLNSWEQIRKRDLEESVTIRHGPYEPHLYKPNLSLSTSGPHLMQS